MFDGIVGRDDEPLALGLEDFDPAIWCPLNLPSLGSASFIGGAAPAMSGINTDDADERSERRLLDRVVARSELADEAAGDT